MQVKCCSKNILETSKVSLSAGAEDPDYPLYRLHDRDIGKMFKFMSVPYGVAASPSVTAGALTAGTYYYKVTALNSSGETLGSTEVSATIDGTNNTAVDVTWNAVTGATSYKLYGRDQGAQDRCWGTSSTNYTDAGASGAAGTVSSDYIIKFQTNLFKNPGFETGDFTGWDAYFAVIENTIVNSGNYSAKLEGSNWWGALSDYIPIDNTKTYKYKAYSKVTVYDSCAAMGKVYFYNSSKNYISDAILFSVSSVTDWTLYEATLRKDSQWGEKAIPSNAEYVKMEATLCDSNSLTTAYYDDFSFRESTDETITIDRLMIPPGHNLNGTTLDLKYSDDDITYTPAVTQWAQSGNDLIDKSFSVETHDYWEIHITPNPSIPEMPEIFLSPTYTWERNPSRPVGPIDDKFNVERHEASGGQTRYLIHGNARKYRKYQLPRIINDHKDNIKILNEAWAGAKPFWLCDHEGIWIYGELLSPIQLMEVSFNKHSYVFEFLEVIGL